jgi:hypothetical protein
MATTGKTSTNAATSPKKVLKEFREVLERLYELGEHERVEGLLWFTRKQLEVAERSRAAREEEMERIRAARAREAAAHQQEG